jgi:hypothetical protein
MPGYGFDMLSGFEMEVDPGKFLEKFRNRWDNSSPTWFYTLREGVEDKILILGPCPNIPVTG